MMMMMFQTNNIIALSQHFDSDEGLVLKGQPFNLPKVRGIFISLKRQKRMFV